MSWLMGLWTAFKGSKVALYGLAALTAIGVVLGVLANERAKGRAQERARANQQALEDKTSTEAIEREVEALPPDELEKRGAPWIRR